MKAKRFVLNMVVVCLIIPLSACGGKQTEGNAIVTETAVTEIPATATAESTAVTVLEIPENEVQAAVTAVSEEKAPLQATDEILPTAEIPSETGNVTDAVVSVPVDKNEKQEEEEKMKFAIGDKVVKVKWEENASVDALAELCAKEPLKVQMSMYGGFEQVGSLGTSLPRNDVQTTTNAGDIVLYSGNQIVVFYGSNSWAYTRLGKITDLTGTELTALLGNGAVTISISVE